MILIYNEIEVGATIGICLEKEKSMENPYSFQAVDKCRNCMSQQPVLMRKSVNVNIKMYKSDKIKMYNYSKLT